MKPSALQIIRAEHYALAAVLHALRQTVTDIRDRGTKPNFEALRALLFYIDAYPERLHHPKESDYLFKRLRTHTTEAGAVLDRLERDHEIGERTIRDLEYKLLEYEMLGQGKLASFAASVENFCDRYMEHMHIEEHDIFPLAARTLTENDWAEIDREFEANRDPLTGHPPEREFEELFRRIVYLLPPPLGIGPEQEASSR